MFHKQLIILRSYTSNSIFKRSKFSCGRITAVYMCTVQLRYVYVSLNDAVLPFQHNEVIKRQRLINEWWNQVMYANKLQKINDARVAITKGDYYLHKQSLFPWNNRWYCLVLTCNSLTNDRVIFDTSWAFNLFHDFHNPSTRSLLHLHSTASIT